MPHINPDGVDFTVVCYIVNQGEVLLAHHINLGFWVPIGGHIDPGEDPEQALLREIEEESGLKVRIDAERPEFEQEGIKGLPRPRYMDIHENHDKFTTNHKHMAMVYFGTCENRDVQLQEDEHHELRWFDSNTLVHAYNGKCDRFTIPTNVSWYGKNAIREMSAQDL